MNNISALIKILDWNKIILLLSCIIIVIIIYLFIFFAGKDTVLILEHKIFWSEDELNIFVMSLLIF